MIPSGCRSSHKTPLVTLALETGLSWHVSFLSLALTKLITIQSEARALNTIAFGELIMHYPDERIRDQDDTLTNALLAILCDAPYIDYDQSLSWEGKFVILVFVTILIRLQNGHCQTNYCTPLYLPCFVFPSLTRKVPTSSSMQSLASLHKSSSNSRRRVVGISS